MLAVLTNRLARIIDRGRLLEAEAPRAAPEMAPAMRDELAGALPAGQPDRLGQLRCVTVVVAAAGLR